MKGARFRRQDGLAFRVLLYVPLLLGTLLLGELRAVLTRPARTVTVPTAKVFAAPDLNVTQTPDGLNFTLTAAAGSALPDGVPFTVTLTTPAGPLVRSAVTRDRAVHLHLPAVRSGLAVYDGEIAGHRYHGQWTRSPGAAVTPLRLKVGARAVRVVGDPPPALVLHPQDVHGNVSDEPVRVTVRQPDGQRWTRTVTVRHLLAWTFLPVGTRTGTLEVAAVVGDARGERAEVDLLPGPVATASLGAARASAPASGRDPWQLDFTQARDRLGNVVLDGSSVQLQGRGPLNFSATQPTVGGAVRLAVPAADTPGRYRVQVLTTSPATPQLPASRFQSAPVTLTSTPPLDAQTIPFFLAGRTLKIGPVRDTLGALPDNGSVVRLSFRTAGGTVRREDTVALTDGRVEYALPALPGDVRVLDLELDGQQERVPMEAP